VEGGEKNAEFSNQDLLHRSARLHDCADVGARIYGAGAEQDFEKKEERKMSEAYIVIVLGAFVFGIIMGLCLGKANK
jgi:hypothetical protein